MLFEYSCSVFPCLQDKKESEFQFFTVKGILYRILEAIWNSISVTLNEENKADKCWHFASIKVDFSKRLDNKLKLSFFFFTQDRKGMYYFDY